MKGLVAVISGGFMLAGLALLSSCEDVIDLELQDAPASIVIDAWLTNQNIDQVIRLSGSQDFFDSSDPQPITGAKVVVIKNDQQVIEFVDEENNGFYRWRSDGIMSLGEVGDKFELRITTETNEYTAWSKMKRVPTIDSLVQEFRDDEIFLDDGIYVEFFARDFTGTGDAYWIKAFKNDTFLNKASELNIAYDAGFDTGSRIDGIVFISPIREFVNELDDDDIDVPWQPGEVSKVEIHSLNQEAFNFLEITRDQINNGSNGIFSLPLANTRSNIVNSTSNNEVLGFFNVAAVSSAEITIQ